MSQGGLHSSRTWQQGKPAHAPWVKKQLLRISIFIRFKMNGFFTLWDLPNQTNGISLQYLLLVYIIGLQLLSGLWGLIRIWIMTYWPACLSCRSQLRLDTLHRIEKPFILRVIKIKIRRQRLKCGLRAQAGFPCCQVRLECSPSWLSEEHALGCMNSTLSQRNSRNLEPTI